MTEETEEPENHDIILTSDDLKLGYDIGLVDSFISDRDAPSFVHAAFHRLVRRLDPLELEEAEEEEPEEAPAYTGKRRGRKPKTQTED